MCCIEKKEWKDNNQLRSLLCFVLTDRLWHWPPSELTTHLQLLRVGQSVQVRRLHGHAAWQMVQGCALWEAELRCDGGRWWRQNTGDNRIAFCLQKWTVIQVNHGKRLILCFCFVLFLSCCLKLETLSLSSSTSLSKNCCFQIRSLSSDPAVLNKLCPCNCSSKQSESHCLSCPAVT